MEPRELEHGHGRRRHVHVHDGPHRHVLLPRRSGVPPGPFANPVYRRLFAAQAVALVGTGVTTIALGLLAYDFAESDAGVVLGAALALKMVAYVGLSPVIAAFAHRFDRRRLLIGLDLARAVVLFILPFVTEIWQVFVLIFVVNACAAGFTPAFQATIPEVLPDEDDYTQALSLSRVAYDLGELLAPAVAAVLLLLLDFSALFAINGATFVLSAVLIAGVTLPASDPDAAISDRTWGRITLGARRFVTVPRLRGLLALNVAAASASAMVIVNTVVLVRDDFNRGSTEVAIALGTAGVGSVLAAIALPRVLRRVSDRGVMLSGAALLACALPVIAVLPGYPALLVLWVAVGIGLSLIQTPAGRLIQRSGDRDDLSPLFAAQFALSHACWLVSYPVAGIVGAALGTSAVACALGATCLAALSVAMVTWPAGD